MVVLLERNPSLASRRSIQEQNSSFRAGQRVKVKWGKSNKLFSAEILSDDEAPVVEEMPTKELPRQSTTAIGQRLPTDLFTFELGSGSKMHKKMKNKGPFLHLPRCLVCLRARFQQTTHCCYRRK